MPPVERGAQLTLAASPHYNPESRSASAWRPGGQTAEKKSKFKDAVSIRSI